MSFELGSSCPTSSNKAEVEFLGTASWKYSQVLEKANSEEQVD